MPPRPPGYFEPDNFVRKLAELASDPLFETYLVRDGNDTVVRVNLIFHGGSVELGYRVAHRARGHGVASFGVSRALERAEGRVERALA